MNVGIRGGAAIFALVSQILLIDIVGVAEYGQYAKYVSLVSFLAVFCKGGYETYIVKKYAELEKFNKTSDASNALFACLLNVLFWASLLLVARAFFKFVGFELLPEHSAAVFFGGVIFLSQYMVCISALRALHYYLAAELMEAIVKPFAIAIVCYFVFGFSKNFFFENSIITSYLVVNGGCVLALFLFVLNRTSTLTNFLSSDGKFLWVMSIKSHISFVIYGLLSLVFFQLDTYFVGVVCGDVVVAAYNMACNFVRIVIFVPLILFVYMQPKLASLKLAHNNNTARILIRNYILVSISFAVAGSAFLILTGRYFLLKVNDGFGIAEDSLVVLSFAHVINAGLIIFNGALLMYERNGAVLKAHAFGAFFAFLGYLILIKNIGIVGAPIAVFLGLLTVAGYYVFTFKNSWKANDFLSKIE